MDALQLIAHPHLRLHAQVERDFLDCLTDEQMRLRPYEASNSIAWLVWHMARCEDLMNFIITGQPQVLAQGDWLSRFDLSRHDIGTGMNDEEVGNFTEKVDLEALKAYYAQSYATPELLVEAGVKYVWFGTTDDMYDWNASEYGA